MNNRIVIAIAVIVAIMIAIALAIIMHKQTRPLMPESIQNVLDNAPQSLSVSSSFSNWSDIPQVYTCDGPNISPPVRVSGIPQDAKCLAIIMFDPDAPRGTFFHWLLYNIPVNGSSIYIPSALPPKPYTKYGIQGVNDFGRIGYEGPCPPPGSKHRYVILVVALRQCVPTEPMLSAPKLLESLRDKVVSYGILVGLYGR